MEEPFNADSLRPKIDDLTAGSRLAFLLSCAERLFPNYMAFTTHHAWGKPDALQEALDLGWKSLEGQTVTKVEIANAMSRCEAATPDMDAFGSELASAALDAAVGCALVLELLIGDDSSKVLEGASQTIDTVDMYVQELEQLVPQDPLRERKILRHPLMQDELKRQREDLDVLSQVDWSQQHVVADLARRWRRPAISNIGLARTE